MKLNLVSNKGSLGSRFKYYISKNKKIQVLKNLKQYYKIL